MKPPQGTINDDLDILIAEDSPTQAEYLKHLLEERGFQVRVATNGRRALALAQEKKPTLVVSDIVMPEMDGYTLCKEIRTHEDLKATPVILVTELSSAEDVIRGLECGANSFVRKPYESRYLLARIDYALANRRLGDRTRMQLGVEISFGGREYFITSERQQILDLLISTYEDAVHMNEDLRAQQERLQRSYKELETLHRLAVSLNEAIGEDQVTNVGLEQTAQMLGVSTGWILLRDGTGNIRLARSLDLPAGIGSKEAAQGECHCLHRLCSGELAYPTYFNDCDFLKDMGGEARKLGYAAVPLFAGDRPLGCLCLANAEERGFGAEELRLLDNVGRQVGAALDRVQMLAGLEMKVEERTAALRAEVAARRRAEEARSYLAAIVESSDDAVIGKRLDGAIASWNRGAERLYGYSAEEVVGRPVSILIPPDHADELRAILAGVARGERIEHYETVRTRKDGRQVHVSISAFPIREAGGQIIGIASIARDISERKQAEATLRASEENYWALFEGAAEGILVVDLETRRVIRANAAACRMLGYSQEELLRLGVDDIHPQEGLSQVIAQFEAPARGDKVFAPAVPCLCKNGTKIYADVSAARMALDARPCILGLLTDVTERVRLEEQLRQAVKMEAIGRLAGGVAHDFNNLLTVISGFGELSLDRLPPTDALRPHLEQILKAADRAATLTRQLLAFSRRQVLAVKVVDLNVVAGDMAKMLQHMLGEDIDLVWNLKPGIGRVKVDPGQIEQVIMNLAVNARDAMPRGGKLTLETANVELDESYASSHVGATPGTYVMLALSDTGVGMDRETQTRVFEPFFTTKERGKGTGLGLATVYGIVKQSGGSIWVYSEPGHGTTFKIYLPRVEGVAEAAEAVSACTPPAGGSETILLAEDDDAVRALLRETLAKSGYTVLIATRPSQAVRLCEEHKGKIDLLLTDLVMPEMSGKDLAEQIQGLYPRVKVLYMSGYTDNAIVHHGVLDSGVAFLQKPFTPDGLLRKVREVLRTSSPQGK
jgi:PAS domain S-box-containing protein